MEKEKLKIERLSKFFGKKEVLHDINFSVYNKEFFCITGRPGVGKTTLLRIIAGLETPTSGNIYINGKLVNDVDPRDRGVSMFFENLALYPNKNAFENIAFPLRVRKFPENEIRRRVLEIAKLLNIEYLLDRLPRTFSGGEAQRVALARTLIRDAEIYLLDEPLSNLDALLRIQARSEFKRLQKDLGKTFVYATHDPIEALALGDRVCVMHNGRILQLDKPEIIYDRPVNKYVAVFVGNPPMNIIPCEVVESDQKLYLRHEKFSIDATRFKNVLRDLIGGEALLGIRPEHIKVYAKKVEGGIPLKVMSIEYLGDRAILYFSFNDILLRVLGEPGKIYNVGESLWIKFDDERIHVIDRQTDKVLI